MHRTPVKEASGLHPPAHLAQRLVLLLERLQPVAAGRQLLLLLPQFLRLLPQRAVLLLQRRHLGQHLRQCRSQVWLQRQRLLLLLLLLRRRLRLGRDGGRGSRRRSGVAGGTLGGPAARSAGERGADDSTPCASASQCAAEQRGGTNDASHS
jgi:hypothetical protein